MKECVRICEWIHITAEKAPQQHWYERFLYSIIKFLFLYSIIKCFNSIIKLGVNSVQTYT